MKNKVVTYLKGLKKEQWIVYLLLAALLVVIAIPVNREGGESGSSGDNLYAVLRIKDNILDGSLPLHQMIQIVLRNDSHHYVDIGQSQIGVE